MSDNKLKRKSAIKRFLVAVLIVIFSYIVLNFIFNSVVFAIKNNPTINCWNKPICIYNNSNINYPSYSNKILNLENGYLFVAKHGYGKYSLIKNLRSKLQGAKYVDKDVSELYEIKTNKFHKIKQSYNEQSFYDIIKTIDNKIVFFPFNLTYKKIQIYDFNKKEYEYKYPNIDKDKEYRFLCKYYGNLLYISNNSDPHYWEKKRDIAEITQDEKLYILNLSTFTLEKFSDFNIMPKYFPNPEDIRVLENGKIIIPIRNRKFSNIIWDHIEIYNPQTNSFSSEKNIDIFKDNIFDIKLENNDILFLNKTTGYIFSNSENKFINQNEKLQNQNHIFINRFLNEIKNILLVDNIEDLKILKLSGNCFLIIRNSTYGTQYEDIFSRTIFVDYNNKIIREGPELKYIYPSDYFNISKTKSIIIGGKEKNCGGRSYCPARNAMYIEYK